ncbi:hypothetical protein [Streptomyces sp. QHH-9511]|uniref:hypothetical protein n=2 Tax=Streptomyces TaxID=1883 RepID=UPI001E4B993F|nr:hypothetical protein [Streptomyces sp. QHH-9511]
MATRATGRHPQGHRRAGGHPDSSLYHYFSDRHQIDAELLEQHTGELDALIGAVLDTPRAQTPSEAVDIMVEVHLGYFRLHPSCTELRFAGRREVLEKLVRASEEAKAERIWHHLVKRGCISADAPLLPLLLAFEVGSQAFDIAFRRSPAGDEAMPHHRLPRDLRG